MKKYILSLIMFLSILSNAQNTLNSYTSTIPFSNTNDQQLYNATRMINGSSSSQTATLTIIKQKQDTINQSFRQLNTLNTTQNSTLTTIKQKQDTINQNLRVITTSLTNVYNRIDTTSRYISVTFTWTSPSTFTPVNGNWATSSTSPMTTFSIALPSGTWKITNVVVINSVYMPVNLFVFSSPFTMGENNSLTNASIANMSKTIAVIDNISNFSQLNGYVGGFTSSMIFKPIPVRNAIYFAASYRATTVCNNVPFYVTFTLEK